MKNKVALVLPRPNLKETYIECVQEFVANHEPFVPFPLGFEYEDFDGLLAKLDDYSKGIAIPEGFVANTTCWLVAQTEVVGVSNLRHELTSGLERDGGHIGYGIKPSQRHKGYGNILLRETLEKARGLGLHRVLLTCAKDNIGSVKVILNNDGVFESEHYLSKRGEMVQLYWIELTDPR